MNNPSHPPHIELANNGLAAKCLNCRKGWAFDTDNPISVDATKLMIKTFILRHIDCVPLDAVEVVRNTGDNRTADALADALNRRIK